MQGYFFCLELSDDGPPRNQLRKLRAPYEDRTTEHVGVLRSIWKEEELKPEKEEKAAKKKAAEKEKRAAETERKTLEKKSTPSRKKPILELISSTSESGDDAVDQHVAGMKEKARSRVIDDHTVPPTPVSQKATEKFDLQTTKDAAASKSKPTGQKNTQMVASHQTGNANSKAAAVPESTAMESDFGKPPDPTLSTREKVNQAFAMMHAVFGAKLRRVETKRDAFIPVDQYDPWHVALETLIPSNAR